MKMNASQIITDDMTLEEKLSAIDAALKAAQDVADDQAKVNGMDCDGELFTIPLASMKRAHLRGEIDFGS